MSQLSQELIVLVGLPGAGKSTYYDNYFARTHCLVSKDLLPKSNRQCRQLTMIAEHLAGGCSVVVDNTNPSVADRAPLIQLAVQYGARPIAVYFDIPATLCRERNSARPDKTRVPEIGMRYISKYLSAPTLAEGFADLIWVRMDARQ